MTTLTPTEPYSIRQTNVSNPSIIHKQPSQQSITASEDYYSLSGSSASASTVIAADDRGISTHSINRFQTPPSRYRTPLQSRDRLALSSRDDLGSAQQPQYAIDEEGPVEVRKTPMRGQGKRRGSTTDETATAGPAIPAVAALREGGVRRKPVPSTVMEGNGSGSPESQGFIDQTRARSSVARDFDRESNAPTPGQDDTPFIRFGLDQLTRDEEVRGSRRYPGGDRYQIQPGQKHEYRGSLQPIQAREQQPGGPDYLRPNTSSGNVAGEAALGAGAAALGYEAYREHEGDRQQPSQQWPAQRQDYNDQPPPRNPRHTYLRDDQQPDNFIPVTDEDRNYRALNFLPGMLRPLSLILFLLLLLVLLALLLFCAIYSILHNGVWAYGTFGDVRYFVFEYLPTLLGMLLFIWLVQIEAAVHRIAPFIALASESPRSREEGALLPLFPQTFFLPYLGHFRAKQAVVGMFMLISWLQIWTIPLLASAFNVHYFGTGPAGHWEWIATAGLIWTVIGIYLLLLLAVILLMVWIRRVQTGLQWDCRSLADIVVLLERSNALSLPENEELQHEPPKLGYWRTNNGGNEVFHSYGIADKSSRQYALKDGRIMEKQPEQPEPKSRFSDVDADAGREQRHSREKMLPKHINSYDEESRTGGRAVPWFLKLSAALLWAIIAIVLLIAFLVVSYLPSTAVSKGFTPDVSAPVNRMGYSSTNFLYSFVPAILAMICFLGLLDIDYAYRRLQPYASLVAEDGELAEKSLLVSYTADLPGFATASALANGHFRVAIISLMSLVAAALPILGGGVFWAEFNIPKQSTRVYAHMPGYYALSAFVALYALTYLIVFPSKKIRDLDSHLPVGNRAMRFQDVLALVHQSKMLDDVAFHNPMSKTALVTRLLSQQPGASVGRNPEAATSKMSLADSVRGLGRARQQAGGSDVGGVPRYSLGRYTGRDGRDYQGIDRLGQHGNYI